MPKEQKELSYSFLEEVKYEDPIKVLIACIYTTSLQTDYLLLYEFFHSTLMHFIEEDSDEQEVKEYVHFMLRMACIIEAVHELANLQGSEHLTYSYPGTDIL